MKAARIKFDKDGHLMVENTSFYSEGFHILKTVPADYYHDIDIHAKYRYPFGKYSPARRISYGICELCSARNVRIIMHHVRSMKNLNPDTEWKAVYIERCTYSLEESQGERNIFSHPYLIPLPIHKSWLYLVEIIDWYSRFVVDWEIDDNLEIYFVLEACKNALKKSAPEIMNSNQGNHFTSPKYTNLFLESGSRISMDHRGRAYDNIFIERLWHTLKYENIYL